MTDFNPPPSSSSSSRRLSPWAWVAIGCGTLFGLFVLLAIAGMIFLARQMNFSANPEDVETQAQSLFTYEIPGGSQGIVTMNFFGIEFIQVGDQQQPPQLLLTVGRFPGLITNATDQQDFLESFQEGYNGSQEFQLEEQRTESRQLCEQTIDILIQRGSSTLYGQAEPMPAWSYIAIVDNKGTDQFAWILASGEQGEANAEAVFSSLNCVE